MHFLVYLCLLWFCEVFGQAPTVPFNLINTFNHDSTSFTEGFLWHEDLIYESAGMYGQSKLFKYNLTSGQILKQKPVAAQFFAEGLSVVISSNGKPTLYQLTWREDVVFHYDLETFDLINSFTNTEQEGWGLTNNGTHLVMSTGSPYLYFINPTTFQVVGSVLVKDGTRSIRNINELEYINGEIWANIWLTNKVARINPNTGVVIAWLDCTSLKPHNRGNEMNGIAYDNVNDRIFITGKNWPSIFEIKLQ